MTTYPSEKLDERSSESSSFQVLHLLPSAPQELIEEVYGHLVHQLQAARRDTPSVRARLDELSEAYAIAVDAKGRAKADGLAGLSEAGGQNPSTVLRPRAPHNGLRERRAAGSSLQLGPWELLHLHPDAPSDIVKLACSFRRLRLGGATEPSLWQTPPSAAMEPQAAANAAEVAESGHKETSRPGRAQAWRLLATTLVTLARWTRLGASTRREQPTTSLKPRTGGSRQAVPAYAPEQASKDMDPPRHLAAPAFHPSVEERLAALATASVGPADRRLLEPEVSRDGAAKAPDWGKTHDDSAQPSREPEATPPSRPETTLQVQPSRMVERSQALAYLIAESGSARGVSTVIGQESFRIGTDPTCDLVITPIGKKRNKTEACIWLQKDRFMFHRIGTTPAVLVNDQPVVWAVLEDGDRLQIGDEVLRFERVPPAKERAERRRLLK